MKDQSLASTMFLWFQYTPRNYYFEVVESLRRITLTAFLTTIGPSAIIELEIVWRRAIGVLLSVIFYVIYRDAQPYQWQDSNIVSNVCQLQIIMTFFACLLLSFPAY